MNKIDVLHISIISHLWLIGKLHRPLEEEDTSAKAIIKDSAAIDIDRFRFSNLSYEELSIY